VSLLCAFAAWVQQPKLFCDVRYGAEIAYGPDSLNLAAVVNTSEGSTPIEFLLWVTDIAGQNVTAGQTLCHCAVGDMSLT